MARAVLSTAIVPSLEHEALVELLREPLLVRCLLRAMGVERQEEGRVADVALTLPDMHCDVVTVFGTEDRPALAVVVEVQRAGSDDKWFAWPYYEAAARARHRCDACVLVLAIDDATAAWARTEIRMGPKNTFRAVVVGPGDVPPFADDPRVQVHLAILGAITQASNESPHAAEAAFEARRVMPALTEDEQKVYWDVIMRALAEEARLELERLMLTKREYTSDFARKYFAEGKAEGKAEGIAEGERTALLAVMRARGFSFPPELMDRIERCADPLVLQAWVERAARCHSVEEIFEDS